MQCNMVCVVLHVALKYTVYQHAVDRNFDGFTMQINLRLKGDFDQTSRTIVLSCMNRRIMYFLAN